MGSNAEPARQLTTIIADDQAVTRTGVRRALEAAGLRVLAEASSASEAVAAAVAHRPDICLLEVCIPGNGILAAEQIRDSLPETKIVMLTASERDEDLFGALRAGADGYLLKTISTEQLPRALRGVVDDGAVLPRVLTARLMREFRANTRDRRLQVTLAGRSVELTAREFEILECMRRGEPTTKIAQRLRISDVTVRRHISAIVHKLGVPDRRAVIALLGRTEDLQLTNLASR
jgi:two-component system, NarL family, nitrate/nitrite response regulator NarL